MLQKMAPHLVHTVRGVQFRCLDNLVLRALDGCIGSHEVDDESGDAEERGSNEGHLLVPALSLVLLEACYDVEEDGKDDDACDDEDRYDQSYGIEVLSYQLRRVARIGVAY